MRILYLGGNRVRRAILRRTASVLCMLAMLLGMAPIGLSTGTSAVNYAESSSAFLKDGVHLDIEKSVTDNLNGYFTLDLRASTYMKETFTPWSVSYSEDGVFQAPQTGYYLIELWGGKGGSGGDNHFLNLGNDGGTGGLGGYVYGCVYVQAGGSLVFTLGTNGTSSTGGQNEGAEGEDVQFYVGGGGGYSAVYLFDSAHDTTITNQERLNNYIMIAGGGGGGGAALMWGLSGDTADGGNGGNIDTSISASLSAEANHGVAGTWFAGSNGQSTNTSTKYIGRGGTNYVGAVVENAKYGISVYPNDWLGTYTKGTAPGNGGNGIWRGGGGGAGFCGGSGGSQYSETFAINVGGGGGGSSFLADSVLWGSELENVKTYLTGQVNSSIGGRININYMGTELTGYGAVDTKPYETAMASVAISKYFDVISTNYTLNGVVMENAVTHTPTEAGGTQLVISGADITPNEFGDVGNELHLSVLIRPKEGFAGGNRVKLYDQQFTIAPAFAPPTDGGTTESFAATERDSSDFINVPLNFKIITHSYSSSDSTKVYPVSSLYEDTYALERNYLRSYWQYDYISQIGTPVVKDQNGYTVTGNVAPTQSTVYEVSLEIRPYYSGSSYKELVGTYSEYPTVLSSKASISIAPADSIVEEVAELNRTITVNAGKALSYDGTHFNLGIEIKQSFPEPTIQKKYTTSTDYSTPFTVQTGQAGWYYVEALGGGGGASGRGSITCNCASSPSTIRTAQEYGSLGGYTGGYIYLKEGDTLHVELGTKGATSADRSYTQSSATSTYFTLEPGEGGTKTTVWLNNQIIMIAGGGGGSGGSAISAASRALFPQIFGCWHKTASSIAPASPGAADYYYTETDELTAWNSVPTEAKRGTANGSATIGSEFAIAQAGDPGVAGLNYISQTMFTPGAPAFVQANFKNYQSISRRIGDGQVCITSIITDAALAAEPYITQGMEAEGVITRYFSIDDVQMDFAGNGITYTDSDGENGYTTRVYHQPDASGEGSVEVARLSYKLTPGTNQAGESCTFYEFRDIVLPMMADNEEIYTQAVLNVCLSPTEGFLGGNDIPLVQYGELSPTGTEVNQNPERGVRIFRNGATVNLQESNSTDFANVPLQYDFLDENFDVLESITVHGQGPLAHSELVLTNEMPLPDEAWKYAYVTFSKPDTSLASDITGNTVLTFIQSIAAIAEPQKATVVTENPSLEFIKKTAVYVQCDITTELEHVTYIGETYLPYQNELVAYLQPDEGYGMETVLVYVGGQLLTDCYDPGSGKVIIPAQSVTDKIHIVASATLLPLSLTYQYISPDIHPDRYAELEALESFTEDYTMGTPVDYTWYDSFMATVDQYSYTGYQYMWEWNTSDGLPPETMPEHDVMASGRFVKKLYTLTVEYYMDGVLQADLTHTQQVYYSDEYTVTSPMIEGYLANTTVISGTMGDSDAYYRVDYTALSEYSVTVIYLYGDSGKEASPAYSAIRQDSESFSIPSPVIEGYTPTEETIAGTFTQGGQVFYVFYVPNTYPVTYNAGVVTEGTTLLMEGATVNESNELVLVQPATYHNIYGFNPGTNSYGEMPQPYKYGATFLGWYTQPDGGELVDEETVVETAQPHTLYARFDDRVYTLTIYYEDTQGNTMYAPYTAELATGTAYEVPSPVIDLYTCDSASTVISGTMGSENIVHRVIYTVQTFNLSISASIFVPKGILGQEEDVTLPLQFTCDEETGTLTTGSTSDTIPLPVNSDFSYENPMPLLLQQLAELVEGGEIFHSYKLLSYSVSGADNGGMGYVDTESLEHTIQGNIGTTDISISMTYGLYDDNVYDLSIAFYEIVEGEEMPTLTPIKDTVSIPYNMTDYVNFAQWDTAIGGLDIDGYASLYIYLGDIATDLANDAVSDQILPAPQWTSLSQLPPMTYLELCSAFGKPLGNITCSLLYVPLQEGMYTTISASYLYSDLTVDESLRGTVALESTVSQYYCFAEYNDAEMTDISYIYAQRVLYSELFPELPHYHAARVEVRSGDMYETLTVEELKATFESIDSELESSFGYYNDEESFYYAIPVFAGLGDVTLTVYYDPNEYTASVSYEYSPLIDDQALAGTAAADTVSVTAPYGTPAQTVTSPAIAGYQPDKSQVTLEFTGDSQQTVYYLDGSTELVSVEIDFGDMVFDLGEARWDPYTHLYYIDQQTTVGDMTVTGVIPPATAGSNRVTVANRGSVPVNVSVSYQSVVSDDFYLDYLFTDESLSQFYQEFTATFPADFSLTGYFWLAGHVNLDILPEDGRLTVGSILITITQGDSNP